MISHTIESLSSCNNDPMFTMSLTLTFACDIVLYRVYISQGHPVKSFKTIDEELVIELFSVYPFFAGPLIYTFSTRSMHSAVSMCPAVTFAFLRSQRQTPRAYRDIGRCLSKSTVFCCTERQKLMPSHSAIVDRCASRRILEKCRQISTIQCPSNSFHTSGKDQFPQDETVMNVFNRKAKCRQRDRAAMAEDVHVYDYLKDEVSIKHTAWKIFLNTQWSCHLFNAQTQTRVFKVWFLLVCTWYLQKHIIRWN